MRQIKKAEAEFYEGDGFSGLDYPMSDVDINFAIINVYGRSPKEGYQVNTLCKEVLYIISGNGVMYSKDKKYDFSSGDVLVIEKGEEYAFEGEFEAAVPCTPAWTSEQHQYIKG